MKEVSKRIVKELKIMERGYDMMGYAVDRESELSYHHLIIPRRECKRIGLGDGYTYWNGSMLTQDSKNRGSDSHDYLHLIERIDYEKFLEISRAMIDERIKGEISKENLKRIREILLRFEKENSGFEGIKENYIEFREKVLTRWK